MNRPTALMEWQRIELSRRVARFDAGEEMLYSWDDVVANAREQARIATELAIAEKSTPTS